MSNNTQQNFCPMIQMGNTSINTDYLSKSVAFANSRGSHPNSFHYRNDLQTGFNKNLSIYNDCASRYNGITQGPSKKINILYDTTGNLADFHKPLTPKVHKY